MGTQFSVLSALDAAVYDETDTLIARGPAQVIPENGGSAVALAMGDILTYTVSGNGSAAFYAPALSTLGVGGVWNDYTAVIQANSPYGIGLQGADVIVNGQIYSGDLVLVITGTTTLQGRGQTLVPNFAHQVVISATNAAVQMGPAALLTGTLPSSVVNGFALPDYTGQLTVSQHTTEFDQITFDGLAARDLSLTLDPSTSSVTPVESASFQAVIASNADDVYDVGVSAPAGWNVYIENSGLITATPPLGAQPGDYALQVTAQSAAAGEPLAATAVHTVTVTAYEGMALSVAPDPLTTVPWGQSAYAFDSDDGINNGRPQIPGAAFIATITNTSSVAHTLDVQVTPSGFSADWILLGGTGRANSAQVSLSPGGVGQLGVYISPVGLATLPAEGTSYPFNVTATAVANPGLSETDNETFIMPAVQFAYVAVQPELIYSAPGISGAFAATVTNVGNSVETFPLSIDFPPSDWAVAAGWNAAALSPGEASTQMITITTPTGELGQTYAVGVRTLSGVYRPTVYVDVELVSPAALPIYEAVNSTRDLCAVTDHEIALPAALEALALSVTELDDSCQAGICALDLRDRVVADLRDVADYTQLAHWTSTTAVSLRQLAASMETHTDQAAISSDIVAVGDQITQLETEFCALSVHDLSLSFTPGVVALLDDGSVADYVLEVINQGDMATTAVISLTVPTGVTGSWSNQSVTLAPGQLITIPTTITPSQRGIFVITAAATTIEAPAIQRQAQAGLNVVDAYLRVIRVTADTSFVDTGTSSTNLSVQGVYTFSSEILRAAGPQTIWATDGVLTGTAVINVNNNITINSDTIWDKNDINPALSRLDLAVDNLILGVFAYPSKKVYSKNIYRVPMIKNRENNRLYLH